MKSYREQLRPQFRFRRLNPWCDTPTDRQMAISERLAEKVKEETGLVVDPQIVRAVRWTVMRHSERSIFENQAELDHLTIFAKLQRRRQRYLGMLQNVEAELMALEDEEYQDD